MVQLFSSSDPGVQKAADLQLVEERRRQRMSCRPAVLVEEFLPEDCLQTRKTLTGAVKILVRGDEADAMARGWEGNSPELWVKAL